MTPLIASSHGQAVNCQDVEMKKTEFRNGKYSKEPSANLFKAYISERDRYSGTITKTLNVNSCCL